MSRIEMPDNRGGMQLTCATLGTFAKYPGASDSPWKKCGFFQQDAELFQEVASCCGMIERGRNHWARHPLSFLLEAADDIAYLTVDFEDAQKIGIIEYHELENIFLEIIDSEKTRQYVTTLKNTARKTEFLRAQVIGVLVREAAKIFTGNHDALMRGEFNTPLTEIIPQSDLLKKIRQRSVSEIYNHPTVAEVVGAGFELVHGMLDIFVPCINELAMESENKGKASYRSRRLAALLPTRELLTDNGGGSPAYRRLLRVLDYVSGMTDHYAVSLYQKLKGISL